MVPTIILTIIFRRVWVLLFIMQLKSIKKSEVCCGIMLVCVCVLRGGISGISCG